MNTDANEAARVNEIYEQRKASGVGMLYRPNRAEVVYERAVVDLVIAGVLAKNGLLESINDLKILDVGCGRGRQLRILSEWGAAAPNLHGLDVFESDIAEAIKRSPVGVNIHLGSAEAMAYNDGFFDVINVNTVISSILDDRIRTRVCKEIVRVSKPGGLIFVYDFVYRNPVNRNVRNVTRAEIGRLFQGCTVKTQMLTMAPPLSRRLGRLGIRFLALVDMLVPFVRTHRMFVIQRKRV